MMEPNQTSRSKCRQFGNERLNQRLLWLGNTALSNALAEAQKGLARRAFWILFDSKTISVQRLNTSTAPDDYCAAR